LFPAAGRIEVGDFMTVLKTALIAGAMGLAAGGASATTATLDFQGFAAGSTNVHYSVKGSGFSETGAAAAGAFEFRNTDTLDDFVAWCIDILTNLDQGPVEYDVHASLLDGDQLGRLQKVFDANYVTDTAASGLNSAAFQVAVWDSIYDTDFDAGAFGSAEVGFKLTSPSSVIDKANDYLSAAESYLGPRRWTLTQYADEAPVSQDLVTVAPIPLPVGALLIGTAFLGAGAVSARARRKAA